MNGQPNEEWEPKMIPAHLKLSAVRAALEACEHARELLYLGHEADAVGPGLARVEQAKYELAMAIGDLNKIEKLEIKAAKKARRSEEAAAVNH